MKIKQALHLDKLDQIFYIKLKSGETMSDNALITILIDNYINLQRILSSNDMQEEAKYQLQAVKAKLESMGIVTSDLDKKA